MSDQIITENLSNAFSDKVLNWFDQQGRKNLPWQKNITPYRVWISEIMLQQTQVKSVIPYFEAFMNRFPDIFALAEADMDEVLSLWSGLGYYARARNLHTMAKKMVSERNGQFPETLEALIKYPGIGRSTAGAILSIGLGKRAAILDGNVRRVLCRFYKVEGFSGEAKTQKQLWKLAEQHTPFNKVGDYTQAMMDLGAMICTKGEPACLVCPLNQACLAYQEGKVSLYPYPRPKKRLPIKTRFMLLLEFKQQILLYKRPDTGIWGGLWSLPEFSDITSLNYFCVQQCISTTTMKYGNVHRHTFSHFHLDVTPVYIQLAKNVLNINECTQCWCRIDHLNQYGLSALVKKLINKREEYV